METGAAHTEVPPTRTCVGLSEALGPAAPASRNPPSRIREELAIRVIRWIDRLEISATNASRVLASGSVLSPAMRIAQIAPLTEAVPPRLYGGTERIVSYLTEELVHLGHDVTVFASGDSRTRATLVPCCPRALRMDPSVRDPLPHILIMLDEVRRREGEFDILHFHVDLMHFPILRDIAARTVTTLHGRLDLRDLQPFYRAFPEFPLVSISNDQRKPMPPVNWAATIHHGLPLDLLRFNSAPHGGYLAFLGRISPEKRPDRAIEIARRAGLPLRLAAKVDAADRDYFEHVIRPLLDDPLVQFVGEIGEEEKSAFLGNACGLLFPIDWPEPFGIVVIEAMACGTPVIAFAHGSVSEILEEGVTGFIVNDVDSAVNAVERLPTLDRLEIRHQFEKRFSAARMARDYVKVYEQLVRASTQQVRIA
jgi:glycosyltransferase involved in cell wall biosynthesis